jgi:hypothetical protein
MQKISNLYLKVIFVMLNFYYKSKKVKYTKLYVPELIEINVLSINPTKESNCEHLFSIISWNISSVRQCFLIKIPEKTVRHHIIYIYIYFHIPKHEILHIQYIPPKFCRLFSVNNYALGINCTTCHVSMFVYRIFLSNAFCFHNKTPI